MNMYRLPSFVALPLLRPSLHLLLVLLPILLLIGRNILLLFMQKVRSSTSGVRRDTLNMNASPDEWELDAPLYRPAEAGISGSLAQDDSDEYGDVSEMSCVACLGQSNHR